MGFLWNETKQQRKTKFSLANNETDALVCVRLADWQRATPPSTKEHTVLRNHDRTGFEEMTSWTVLTWYIGMNTTF